MSNEKFTKLIKENLALLKKSVQKLEESFQKCQNFDYQKISNENLESIEAFTARFSRTADIFTQKLVKSILIVLRENPQTFLDKTYFLEKIKIINKADDLLKIRDLRNQIAHEYSTDDLDIIFQNTQIYTPLLLEIIKKATKYINDNLF